MITRRSLYDALVSTGIPVVLNAWRAGGAPELPYVVYTAVDPEHVYADNRVFFSFESYDVELYTPLHTRDFDAESRIEAALSEAGATWRKSFPGPIEDQRMTETCWTVPVVDES